MAEDVRERFCPVLNEVSELGQVIVGDVVSGLPAWMEQCRSAFARFQECLQKHISYESQAGFHRRMRETAPSESRRITELSGEHIRLLGESEAISQELSTCALPDSAKIRDIIRQIENLVAHYRYHAASELELARRILGDSADPRTQRLCHRPCSFRGQMAQDA